jgi:putative peptidoglycan lipid II flippase
MTAYALAGYSIGLTGYAAIKVLSPAFYALNDAKTPMIIALCSILVNIFASYGFKIVLTGYGATETNPSGFGHVGVALATSCVALVNFFALALLMRRKIKGINGRDIISSFVKIAIASAIMSAVCYFSYYLLHNFFVVKSFIVRAAEALVPIALGGITFFVVAKVLGVSEMEKVYNAFARKLRLKNKFNNKANK